MKPAFLITSTLGDLGRRAKDRLLSITITDEAGFRSDALSISFDDRSPEITIPEKGNEIRVWLGYEEGGPTGLMEMGTFSIDETRSSGFPSSLEISAHAVDMAGSYKVARDETYHGNTLGTILATVAQRHGYQLKVANELAFQSIEHYDQVGQSDMDMVQRFAAGFNAVAKVVNGSLVFADRGRASSLSGVTLPNIDIELGSYGLKSYDYLSQSRSQYGGVTAKYWDFDLGEEREVVAVADNAEGRPPYKLPGVYSSAVDALQVAQGRLDALNASGNTLKLEVLGDPRIRAETRILLSGFRSGIPTSWEVLRAVHTYSGSGYTTTVDCELPDN